MSAAYIEIRRLTEADEVLYRDIRLEALRANPEAFGSTFETENAQPLSSFSTTLGNSTVLGAFRNSEAGRHRRLRSPPRPENGS